jgi:NADH:ubiquinone oxidoreductase subunit C
VSAAALEAVPGFIELKEAHRETTIVVGPAELVAAGLHLRDELGYDFLSDITAVDYLGWGGKGVAGYIGTRGGRDLNTPMTQGLQALPAGKPKRFALNYHLLSVVADGGRIRLQAWVDDGEPVPSVIEVWPTADWHEREAYDMLGINIVGHPNLKRILMDDDWDGHPLRKDYPLGGEPVRFSGEE